MLAIAKLFFCLFIDSLIRETNNVLLLNYKSTNLFSCVFVTFFFFELELLIEFKINKKNSYSKSLF